jgi:hypothetical protein
MRKLVVAEDADEGSDGIAAEGGRMLLLTLLVALLGPLLRVEESRVR